MGIFNLFKPKTYTLTDNNFAREFMPFGLGNISKQKVLREGYVQNPDAFSVVKKIVDVTKSTPWIVERRVGDEWEELEGSTIQDLIDNPNSNKKYTWEDVIEQYLTYLLCNGNAYLHGEELGPIIKELDVLPPQFITINTNDDFFLPNLRYNFNFGTTSRSYDNDTLSHLRFFNPSFSTLESSYNGLSAFEVAYRVIQVGNDKWEADSHLLKNKGIAGILSSNTTNQGARPMSADEAKAIQQAYDRESNGTSKFGKIRVTNKDVKYIQMGMSATDLQLVQKDVITLRAMCNVFSLDSSLFNDPANKTFNNRLEAEKALYTNAVIPLSEKVSKEFTRYIARNHYPDGSVRMRQDFSKVEALQKDQRQEAEKDKVNMEGINIVLNMPISNEGKKALLTDEYNFSDEKANSILNNNDKIQN